LTGNHSALHPVQIPCSRVQIPCFFAKRILLQAFEFARLSAFKIAPSRRI
jgi:hypothetical protein